MIGVPREIAEHRLNANPSRMLVRQKKRVTAPERSVFLRSEVEKLVDANILREIQIAEGDEDKTAFHTDHGIVCYTKMPFGLKNAGATYQRVIVAAFKSQIGRNVEAYVDDLVIKSHMEFSLLKDVQETFDSLRKTNMKLNPNNYKFGLKKVLKESIGKSFNWILEAENAFQEMKTLIKTLPTLTAPVPGETLTVYLAASTEAISSVLVTERDETHMPVYFVNKVLQHGEVNYNPVEKLVLSKPEISGRIPKWEIELGEHEISYAPRNAGPPTAVSETAPHAVTWELFTDEASSSDGAVEKMGIKALKVAVDSQLVANQLNGMFEVRYPAMQKYLKLAEELANKFDSFSIMHVPRSMNKKANALSKLASLTFGHFAKDVWVEVFEQKSTDVVAAPVEEVNTWMNLIINYHKDGTLPTDSVLARKIRMKAPMYVIRDNVLYKKSFLSPLLRCVGPQEAETVIREVHEGTCEMHSGFRTVV
ncbi:uncharacterized protein [Rutidosis leptorrhynchoides]|uniref:uncharacterized protein n=1 Tax=Rutidosis leptorrhynchoides TaxID=125765 RepID=UPI003A993378